MRVTKFFYIIGNWHHANLISNAVNAFIEGMFKWTDTEFSHVIPRHDVISADPLKLIKAIPIASHFTESALKTLVEKNKPLSLRIAMDVEAMEPLETPPPVSRRAIIVKTLLVVAGIVGGAVMFV